MQHLHMYTKVHNKKIPRYNIIHRQEPALKMITILIKAIHNFFFDSL